MIHLASQHSKLAVSPHHQPHPLYEVSNLEQKSVHALRSAFNQWIRHLPMEERFLALKIYSGPIPQILRKSLAKLYPCFSQCSQMPGLKCDPQMRGQSCDETKRTVHKLEKGFYDSLVFISDGRDYMDHICFEFGLLECPEKLFDLLVSPVDNQEAKLLLEVMKNHLDIEIVMDQLLKCTNLEELAINTLNYLRQQVFLRFRESMLDSEFLARSLEEEKRQKKEFSIHLKHLSQDLKKRIVLLGFKDVEQLKQWFMSHQLKIDFFQMEKEAQELIKLQKNQFCNRIFKCKLKRSMSDIVNYHQQIYLYWKKEVAKNKKRKSNKNMRTEKIQKDLNFNTKCQEPQQKLNHPKRHKKRHKKSVSIESNQTNVTQHEKQIEKSKEFTQIDTPQKCQLPKQEQQTNQTAKVMITNEIHSMETLEKKKINKKRKPKDTNHEVKHETSSLNKIKIFQVKSQVVISKPEQCIQQYSLNQSSIFKPLSLSFQQIKEFSISMISDELQDFADKISQQANLYHDRRIIAFERIQFLLGYYYLHIELFGSCASGIAIRNSDIDIAVKSDILAYFEYLPQQLRLIGALEYLQQIFSTQSFISEINLIKTASIPVIKLKIDTSKICLDPQYGETYERLNRPHNSGIIQADITIETLNLQSQSNHLGILSTQTINQWLHDIPTLHYIVIALKLLLHQRGFNKTYQGGLNTFSIVVLIVAYIYHAKLQQQTNSALVLQGILRFYAYQFDQKQTCIDILNYRTQNIYHSKKLMAIQQEIREKADLQILDPKCNRKNITRKCYLFPYIKQFFKEIIEKCFDQPLKELQELIKIQQSYNLPSIDKIKQAYQKGNCFELLLQTK